MNLRNDTRQNIQMELDFSPSPTGEAREAGREETESRRAINDPESPASTNRWMEEVCERENLKEAWRRVKANKGSPGVDGMTVGGITDYLKQHWPAIRELLNGPMSRSRRGGWKSPGRTEEGCGNSFRAGLMGAAGTSSWPSTDHNFRT